MDRNLPGYLRLLVSGLIGLTFIAGCAPAASTLTQPVDEVASHEVVISLPGTDVNTILVTDQGKLLKKAQFTSSDGNIGLFIDAGTTLLDSNNKPLQLLEVAVDSNIPIPPEDTLIIGNMVEIRPSGANINPSFRLALKYDPALLPPEVSGNDIWISNYTGSSWEMMRYKNVDTGANQVTTTINSFGKYSILSPTTPQPAQPRPAAAGFLEALENGKPTLAEFGSNTCVPCKQMKPILEQLSVDYTDKLNVVIIEIYDERQIAGLYRIMTIPTQVIFDSSGNEVTRHIGVWPREQIEVELDKLGVS